jgi:LysM repeat protein
LWLILPSLEHRLTFREDPSLPPPDDRDDPQVQPGRAAPSPILPCPFLGFADDVQVHYTYPESGNYCHRVRPPQPVALAHQQAVCLAGEYRLCPVNKDDWRGPLPPDLRGEDYAAAQSARKLWLWLAAGAAVLLLIALAIIFIPRTSAPLLLSTPAITQPQSAILNTPTPTIINQKSTILNTPTPTIINPTSTIINTSSPTPTIINQQSTIINTPGPLAETPFASGGRYLVHVVHVGEVMDNIAARYHTSVAVLLKVNWANRSPIIWADTPIVLLPGVTDPAAVQELQVIWLDQRTLLSGLAQQYAVSASELRTLNDLGSGEWVEGQRWIIFPPKSNPFYLHGGHSR